LTDNSQTVLDIDNTYSDRRRKSSMRSNGKTLAPVLADDFEDISIVKNLLELQSRLKTKTDSIENQSD
jgi:hypothetical protein